MGAAALLALPVSAQDSVPPPQGASIGEAVALTILANLQRRGLSGGGDVLATLPTVTRMDTLFREPVSWVEMLNVYAHALGWFPLPVFDGFQRRLPQGESWGVFDRSDPSIVPPGDAGYGDEDCQNLKFERAADPRNIKIPSIPMQGSGNIRQGEMTWHTTAFVFKWDFAATSMGASLWGIHNANMGLSKERWGAYHTFFPGSNATHRWDGSFPSYIDAVTGKLELMKIASGGTARNQNHWDTGDLGGGPGTSQPCPREESGGGDFDFYSHNAENRYIADYTHQTGCTLYGKNYSLSPSGYGYAPTVEIRADLSGDRLRHNPQTALCSVSSWTIRVLADRMFEKATRAVGYAGPAYAPIEPEDVRVPGAVPNGTGLARKPQDDLPVAPPPVSGPPAYQPPPPDYVPPPGSGGGADPGGDAQQPGAVDVTSPTIDEPGLEAPEIEMPDWFPGFEQFTIPLPQGDCPVFGFDAFEERLEMTSHCSFIDQNSVTIASIMLVVFAFGAYSIIMRA